MESVVVESIEITAAIIFVITVTTVFLSRRINKKARSGASNRFNHRRE
jgi:hypothetical protein